MLADNGCLSVNDMVTDRLRRGANKQREAEASRCCSSSPSLTSPFVGKCGVGLRNTVRDGEDSFADLPQLRPTTASVTGARPEKPSTCAAAGVTSMTRPRMNGPRSLMRTTTERPEC